MDKIKYLILFLLFIVIAIAALQKAFIQCETINMGNNIKYNINRKDILGRSFDIPPEVIAYKFNKHYIYVKQRIRKGNNVIYTKYEYPSKTDTIFYWIIRKDDEYVIGPLMYSDFENSCGKLSGDNQIWRELCQGKETL